MRVCSHTGCLKSWDAQAHLTVFEQTGVDTSVYTGFAFGMGIERLAMLDTGLVIFAYFTKTFAVS